MVRQKYFDRDDLRLYFPALFSEDEERAMQTTTRGGENPKPNQKPPTILAHL